MRIGTTAVRRAAIVAMSAAAVALAAPPASAQTARDLAASGELSAQGCAVTAGSTRLSGGTAARPTAVRLWRCDNGWHAQIIHAKAGDEVWVTNATGVVTGFRKVPSGSTSMNSGTVGIHGSPWRACGKIVTSGNAYPAGCTPFG
ncbi:hypothetical protein GCM10010412_085580 [Nonomuraea recticatena]|uniref:Secreted protein n=1 Tax=Nonomuraea recticatena TaxID=46178 RepID=A0ABP6FM24_9ACTN